MSKHAAFAETFSNENTKKNESKQNKLKQLKT